MRVLATVSDMQRVGIILDLNAGTIEETIEVRPEFIDAAVVGRPACRPFGITWDATALFVANNKQLLVYDQQLNWLRIAETRLQVNVHQLAYRAGRVWAVSPWTNSLIGVCPGADIRAVEFDLLTAGVRRYVERDALETSDRWHFNSVLWTDEALFVAAHTFGQPSFIKRYNAVTLQLDHVYREVGKSIHGLARYEGELFWISTGTGAIRSDAGYCQTLPRPGYARGFAMTKQHFVVATSMSRPRAERHAGDAWIHVIDRETRTTLQEVRLPGTGAINDLRLLDEYDYAHGVKPLWNQT